MLREAKPLQNIAVAIVISLLALLGLQLAAKPSQAVTLSSSGWAPVLELTRSDTVNTFDMHTPWTFGNIDSSRAEFNTFSAVTNTSTLSFAVSNRLSQQTISSIAVYFTGFDTTGMVAPPNGSGLNLQPRSISPFVFSVSGDVTAEIFLSSGKITDYTTTVNSNQIIWTFYIRETGPNADFMGDFFLHVRPDEIGKTDVPGVRPSIGFLGDAGSFFFGNKFEYPIQSPRWQTENYADLTQLSGAGAVTNNSDLTFTVANPTGYSISRITYVFNGIDASSIQSVSATAVGTQPTAGSPYRASFSGQAEMDFWLDSGTLVTFSAISSPQFNQLQLEFQVESATPSEWRGQANLKILNGEITTTQSGAVNFFIYGAGGAQGRNQIYYGDMQVRTLQQSLAPSSPATPNNQTPAGAEPAPASYVGPQFEISSPVRADRGETISLSGKKLSEVSSVTIDDQLASIELVGGNLLIQIPVSASPGLHDLVIQSGSYGKLTHINAVLVSSAPVRDLTESSPVSGEANMRQSVSFTNRNLLAITETQILEQLDFSSRQDRNLNKVRCIVNSRDFEKAQAQAQELCDRVKAANPHIVETIVEPRSTVPFRMTYARVVYGWAK